MRIKIKDNAAGLYSKRTADFQYSPEWYKFLKEIQGKVIEVKTNYLFEYFFNFEYQREGEEVKLYAVTGDMVKMKLVPLDFFEALPVIDITNKIRRVNHEC